jgi:glycosyltransferase involved in cell wall biosynthesis
MAEALCIEPVKIRPYRTRPRRHVVWRCLLAQHRGSDLVLVRGAFGETPINELLATKGRVRRLYTIEHSPGLPRRDSRLGRVMHGAAMRRRVYRSIMVSQNIAELAMDEFGLPADRIAICENWVDPAYRPPRGTEREAARAALGIEGDRFVIGYVGRLSLDKCGDMLIRAFAEARAGGLGDAILVLAGDGWKAEEWRGLARELGIAEHVLFPGWQRRPQAIYHALDLFVLPSRVEGFPLALMEAMVSGVPGLAHPMGSTLALMGDGAGGFLQDMASPAGFAACLRRIAAMPARLLQAMGLAASAHVANGYSRAKRLPAVLAALDIPLDGRALPPAHERALTFARPR